MTDQVGGTVDFDELHASSQQKMQWIGRIEVWRSPRSGRYVIGRPIKRLSMYTEAQLGSFIRPPIEAGDGTFIHFDWTTH